MEEQLLKKKNSYSKYIVGIHQLAAFEEYFLKLPENEIVDETLFALNATLLGMHPISMEIGEFIN